MSFHDRLIQRLIDPDERGESEYRAIYDLLNDALASVEDERDERNMAEGVLVEVIEHAANILTDLRNGRFD